MQEELGDTGFTVIAVAIDQDVDKIREGVVGASHPVLIDRDQLLPQLYAFTNVPMTVWIDEAGRIVRPNSGMFTTNMFKEFTGIDAEVQLDLVRAWVHEGVVDRPADAEEFAVADLSPDEEQAHLHYRAALHMHRHGDDGRAAHHFDRAAELAPWDFTIRRAQLPLRGGDPFGQEFFEFYQPWLELGRPTHGFST